MIVRNVGTVLTAVAFAMLATAALIRDPTALDANIGAGGLILVGIPLGVAGLFLLIVGAVFEAWRRGRRPRTDSR